MEKQQFNLPRLEKDNLAVAKVFDKIMNDEWARAFIQQHELTQDFIMDNLTVLLRFVEENTPCQQCPGLQACQKDPKGYDTLLLFGELDLEIAYQKCEKNLI